MYFTFFIDLPINNTICIVFNKKFLDGYRDMYIITYKILFNIYMLASTVCGLSPRNTNPHRYYKYCIYI